jgi:hypothetical protein
VERAVQPRGQEETRQRERRAQHLAHEASPVDHGRVREQVRADERELARQLLEVPVAELPFDRRLRAAPA